METYGYAIVHRRAATIDLKCTDPSFVKKLLEMLAGSVKKFQVSAWQLPTGEFYRWRLYRMSEDLDKVWWLIIQQFCRHGWEPLENAVSVRKETINTLHFKYKGGRPQTDLDLDSWHTAWSAAGGKAVPQQVSELAVSSAHDD